MVLVGFVWWERRVVARGRPPLLDIRLLTGTPGYASGALLGTVYFVGFSGIWLVFALYLQSGLGYTPLQSGLSVTPFALGCGGVGGRRRPPRHAVGAAPDGHRSDARACSACRPPR